MPHMNGTYHGVCNYTCECREPEPFTPWTTCPSCGTFEVHWISARHPEKYGVLRLCRNLNCQFLWRTQ